ncbi:MAG: phage scaffolding protein [Pseudomonadota bacterium]|nr:phage scaffolding protein [Pseudomonadota bacterium]
MKRRLLMRRLSVSAPRVSIKSHLPWPLRALLLMLVIGLGGAVAAWTYDLGRQFAGMNGVSSADVAAYKAQLDKLAAQRDKYSSTVASADNQLIIERTAKQQLAGQVKTLEAENSKLKEDLAFFESLLPTDGATQALSIRRMKVDLVSPAQLRYRLLLMQGGRGKNDFSGNLQLAVTTLQAGRTSVILFPAATPADADKFKLSFQHYQRVEGVITLPEGASVKSVQARVLERGQLRTQLSANL